MPYSRFFSLKWQIFTITGALSLLALIAILAYWQESLFRAEELSREEDSKTAGRFVDTIYPVWQEQVINSTDVIARDPRVRHLLANPVMSNKKEVNQLLTGVALASGADFFIQVNSKSNAFSVFYSLPSLEFLGNTIYSGHEYPVSRIKCYKDSKCWNFITVPVLLDGVTVGNVTAGYPLAKFFAMTKGGRIPADIATFQVGDPLPNGWKKIETRSLKLPDGVQLAGYALPQGHIEIIQSSIKSASILGGITFMVMQLFIIMLLIKRLSYVKMLESGFAMMLLGKSKSLKAHLARKSRLRFVDELDKIGETMVKTGEQLNALRVKEEQAAEDRARHKITEYVAEERKQLLSKFAKAEEEMRQSLARELHDEVGSRLVSMKVDLLGIKRMESLPEAILERVVRVERNCLFLNTFLHTTIENLTPTVVGDFGLSGSVKGLIQEWESSLDGRINFDVDIRGDMHSIPFAQATAAYRIIQESLTNVAKYSEANNVKLRVYRAHTRVSDDALLVDIQDDGKGFYVISNPQGGGRGLQGIRDRVTGFGGLTKIRSHPGKGTRIQCIIPILEVKPGDDLSVDTLSKIFLAELENEKNP